MIACELRQKYLEMLRLRELHAGDDEPDPRRDMVALASRFPGALREIDELPMDELRARVAELGAAEADATRLAPWMRAQWRFHAMTRGALCAKRWLSGRKGVDDELLVAFDVAVEGFCWPDDARAWRDELHRVAKPPRGRITDLVFDRIARELAVTSDEARALVFPAKR